MNKRLDLGKENEFKLFWSFVLPAVLGMVAVNTASIVDSYFIGNYIGADAIGAITLIMPIMSVIIGIATMIVSGGVVLASIEYGKKDIKKANEYFNLTFAMTIIAAIIIMVVVRFFIKYYVDLINISEKAYVFDYFYTLLYFVVAFMLLSFFSFFLKVDSMPKVVVSITILGVLINVVLDYVLVAVMKKGMAGAAFATGLAQVIPVIIFFVITIKKSKFDFQLPKFDAKVIKSILFNGSSELIGLSAIGIAGYIYNYIISEKMGIGGVAAYGIAMQVANVSIMIFYGISEGVQSIISYNFGARKLERVDRIRNIAFSVSLIFGVIIFAVIMFAGQDIVKIFVKEENVILASTYIVKFYGIALIITGINLNATTYYTALGQPVKSAMIALMRSLIGLVVGLLILPIIFQKIGLWLPIIFTEVVTLLLVIYYIKKYPYGVSKANML